MRWSKLILVVAVSALTLPLSVNAKQRFASYEGPDATRTGQGGSKISKHGIDYWTTGSPPKRFQIIGVLTDARKDRLFDGEVVGSASVAKIVQENGGDAVVIEGEDARVVGVSMGGTSNQIGQTTFHLSHGKVVTRTMTQMLVIKYLPADQ